MNDEQVAIQAAEVRAAGRKAVSVSGRTVVVFEVNGGFVAYLDTCAHQGGPVCSEGTRHPLLTARVASDGRPEDYFADDSDDRILACPWHGWEYDLTTGQGIADRSKSLRSATVEQRGEELLISL